MPQEKNAVTGFYVNQEYSPLTIVDEILLSQQFSPAPEDAVRDNEIDINVLSSREKAIYTASNLVFKEYDSLVDEFQAMKNEGKSEEADIDAFRRKTRLKKELHEFFNFYLETSIKQRLEIDCEIGIRENYQIVKFKDTKE